MYEKIAFRMENSAWLSLLLNLDFVNDFDTRPNVDLRNLNLEAW